MHVIENKCVNRTKYFNPLSTLHAHKIRCDRIGTPKTFSRAPPYISSIPLPFIPSAFIHSSLTVFCDKPPCLSVNNCYHFVFVKRMPVSQ